MCGKVEAELENNIDGSKSIKKIIKDGSKSIKKIIKAK
jgi:hypothetical protein